MSKTPQEKLLKLAEAMEDPAKFAYKETERLDDKIDTEVTRLDDSIKTISLTPGDKGEKGDKGDKGDTGEKGADGKDGRDGKDGKDGLNGKDGKDGEDGLDGKDGEKGDKGDQGKIPDHKWEKTKLFFEKPNGQWGLGVDLEGPEGQTIIKRMVSGGGGSGGGGTGTITGTGVANQIAYWDSTTSLTGDTDFTFDGTNLMVGNVTSVRRVNIDGSLRFKSLTAASNVLMYVGATGVWTAFSGNFFLNAAGNTTTTGSSNLGIGGASLKDLTTGLQNVGIGSNVFQSTTEGSNNFGVGYQTMYYNLTGSNNVALGAYIQGFATTATDVHNNTLIGAFVQGGASAGGSYNTLIGNYTQQNLSGIHNVFITASDNLETGLTGTTDYNIGIGFYPLDSNANISRTIGIGANAAASNAGSYSIYIGDEVNGTSTNNELVIGNGSGNTITGNLTAKSVGIDIAPSSITARLHLPAGTATASTAPLKFTSGTLLTAAEAGAVEFLTDKFYGTITTGAARKELLLADSALTSGRIPYATTNGRLIDDADLTFDGTTLGLGVTTTAVTDSDFVIGVSSTTRRGLVVQTKSGTTLPAFEIQDSAGVAKTRFDTTGNSAMRINYSGTMAAAQYAGFVLSLQNINDAGEGSWLEILNSGGANKGAFFGMYGNQFQLFNWQGGDTEFWTGLTTSAGTRYVRAIISVDGNMGLDGNPAYSWTHGWGGGKGVFALANAQTAPTTSLTTALAMYSVSGELWYMAPSNQARKVVASTAALTSGRVPVVTTGGLLTDDADMTFATDTLTVDKVSVDDDAYGAGWNGSLLVPTRNAVYDKIETLTPSFKSGTTTRTGDTASGNQVIAHGLGKVPTVVRVTAIKRNADTGIAYSHGVSNGTVHSEIYYSTFTAGDFDNDVSSDFLIVKDDDAGNFQYASGVTLDATNITIAWVKVGSPSATQIKLLWEVQ